MLKQWAMRKWKLVPEEDLVIRLNDVVKLKINPPGSMDGEVVWGDFQVTDIRLQSEFGVYAGVEAQVRMRLWDGHA